MIRLPGGVSLRDNALDLAYQRLTPEKHDDEFSLNLALGEELRGGGVVGDEVRHLGGDLRPLRARERDPMAGGEALDDLFFDQAKKRLFSNASARGISGGRRAARAGAANVGAVGPVVKAEGIVDVGADVG